MMTESLEQPEIKSDGATQEQETLVNQGVSGVRNPEKLLELFNAQKDELKALKSYKKQQDDAIAAAEAKRLEEKGAYESLLPIKIQEAVTPVNQALEVERKRAEKLATDLAKAKAEYESLSSGYKQEKLKSLVNQAFTAQDTSGVKGDPAAFDLFWKGYGDKFALDEASGTPAVSDFESPAAFLATLHKDPTASRLFLANMPEGSGSAPQSTSGRATGTQPKVLSTADVAKSRDKDLMVKIMRGEVVVRD